MNSTTTTTVHGHPLALFKALLILPTLLAVSPFAAPLEAATFRSSLFGVDVANTIWAIDPALQTTSRVITSTEIGQTANALAFDQIRGHLFFVNAASTFDYWEAATNTVRSVGGSSLGLTADPNNAAFYNDAFWYFEHDSNVLRQAKLSYTGSGETVVPSVSDVRSFPVFGMNDAGINTNSFGDIAIDETTGTLYAYTSRGRFYSVDLSDPINTFTEISPSQGNDRTVGMQLSFDAFTRKLIGHNYRSGDWYEINPMTGGLTQIAGFNTLVAGGRGFRDLGGAAPVPEPSTIGLAAVGVMGGLGYTRLRRRKAAGADAALAV